MAILIRSIVGSRFICKKENLSRVFRRSIHKDEPIDKDIFEGFIKELRTKRPIDLPWPSTDAIIFVTVSLGSYFLFQYTKSLVKTDEYLDIYGTRPWIEEFGIVHPFPQYKPYGQWRVPRLSEQQKH